MKVDRSKFSSGFHWNSLAPKWLGHFWNKCFFICLIGRYSDEKNRTIDLGYTGRAPYLHSIFFDLVYIVGSDQGNLK